MNDSQCNSCSPRLTTAAWTGWVYFNEKGLQAIGDGLECLCQFAADLDGKYFLDDLGGIGFCLALVIIWMWSVKSVLSWFLDDFFEMLTLSYPERVDIIKYMIQLCVPLGMTVMLHPVQFFTTLWHGVLKTWGFSLCILLKNPFVLRTASIASGKSLSTDAPRHSVRLGVLYSKTCDLSWL